MRWLLGVAPDRDPGYSTLMLFCAFVIDCIWILCASQDLLFIVPVSLSVRTAINVVRLQTTLGQGVNDIMLLPRFIVTVLRSARVAPSVIYILCGVVRLAEAGAQC